MLEVHCPNPACGRKLRAPDSSAGRKALCPICGTSITLVQTELPLATASPAQPGPAQPGELRLEEPAPAQGGPWDAAARFPEPAAEPRRPGRRFAPVALVVAVAVALGVAALLLLPGGGIRRKGVFGTPPPGKSTYQGPKVEMKILLNPGRFTIVESQEDRGTQKVRAGRESQEVNTSSSLRVDGDVEILPPDPATGERRMTYTCTRVKLDTVQGPRKMSFNSDDPKGSPRGMEESTLAGILGPMVGWKLIQVYSKDCEFLRMDGFDDLLDKMRASPGGAQAAGLMKKMLEPLLRDALTRHWRKLIPTTPVGPGDKWERKVDLEQFPMFGRLDFDFTCWLTDVEDSPAGKVAVMVCDGAARLRNRDLNMGDLGMPGSIKARMDTMTLLLRMTVKFPIAVGMATEVTGDIDLDGSMSMRMMNESATSALQQTSKFSYTLKPK